MASRVTRHPPGADRVDVLQVVGERREQRRRLLDDAHLTWTKRTVTADRSSANGASSAVGFSTAPNAERRGQKKNGF